MAIGASVVLMDYVWRTRGSDMLNVGEVLIFNGQGCEIDGAGEHVLPWIGQYLEASQGGAQAGTQVANKYREKDEYTALDLENAVRIWCQAVINKFHATTLSTMNHCGRGRATWRIPAVPDSVRDVSGFGTTLEMLNDECFTLHNELDHESTRKIVCIPISMTGLVANPFTRATANRDLARL
jgi:hypothetical protein